MNKTQFKRFAPLLVLVILFGFVGAACEGIEEKSQPQDAQVENRQQVFERAEDMYPVPPMENFPQRASLVEHSARKDMVNHPYYVYIMSMTGEYIGYFVAKTYPINDCNFLSSTEQIVRNPDPDMIIQAPSYDGMFYGGSGASGACQSLFFLDYATNADITFNAPMWIASDVDLGLDIPKLGPKSQ